MGIFDFIASKIYKKEYEEYKERQKEKYNFEMKYEKNLEKIEKERKEGFFKEQLEIYKQRKKEKEEGIPFSKEYFQKENKNEERFFFKENSNFNEKYSILKPKKIFTNYELIFFNELKNFLKNKSNLNLLTKIRIADLVEAKKSTSYSEFMKIFNKINRKHIDFIITDTKGEVLVLIELDGYSHNYQKTIESDKLKNELFKTLKIPLIRFKNGYSHNLEILNNYI